LAYSLFADGGDYEGSSFTGVGVSAAITVIVRGMGELTAQADFPTFVSVMNQACTELIGLPLRHPLTNATIADQITSVHCQNLEAAFTKLNMEEASPCLNASTNPYSRPAASERTK